MGKRRRTPDLVTTVTGEQPVEKAALEQAKPDTTGDTGGAGGDESRGGRGQTATKPRARKDREKSATSDASEGSVGDVPRWSAEPKRSNFTFRLSEEVSDELERLILALRFEHGVRASRSEITEVALQLAIEDAGKRGEKSDVVKRLSGKLRRRDDAKTASK